MSKLKIDLNNGILEVEGEEGFVKGIYEEYKNKIFSRSSFPNSQKDEPAEKPNIKQSTKKTPKTNGKSSRKETYSIVKDLQLKDLSSFFKEKNPKTGFEKNVVFVYFLEKTLNTTNISPDHIYTCYKQMQIPVPKALKQSLVDTGHKKGWIDTSSISDITMTTVGENIVEHSLTKSEDK